MSTAKRAMFLILPAAIDGVRTSCRGVDEELRLSKLLALMPWPSEAEDWRPVSMWALFTVTLTGIGLGLRVPVAQVLVMLHLTRHGVLLLSAASESSNSDLGQGMSLCDLLGSATYGFKVLGPGTQRCR